MKTIADISEQLIPSLGSEEETFFLRLLEDNKSWLNYHAKRAEGFTEIQMPAHEPFTVHELELLASIKNKIILLGLADQDATEYVFEVGIPNMPTTNELDKLIYPERYN